MFIVCVFFSFCPVGLSEELSDIADTVASSARV